MRIRTGVVLVLAVLATATVPIAAQPATAFGTNAQATTTRTAEHVVDPVTATGIASGFRVISRVRGDCWTSSDVIAGAHRCISHNLIHDPCWFDPAATGRHIAVCPVSPSSRRLVKLHSRTRLPRFRTGPIHRAAPWGVTLANGWQCVFADGARDLYRGKTVNLSCGRHPGRHYVYLGGIYGPLHRSQQPWTASVAKFDSQSGRYSNLGPIVVTDAWYGRVRYR
jgi:hypothetical protein